GRETRELPDDGDDRNVDLGEDVDRRPGDGQHAADGDQHRHHDEGVRPAEGEADDPHRSTYGPSVRMTRGIASSQIATAVPLRFRELGDPETPRPWATPGSGRAAGRTVEGFLCRSVGRSADRSAGDER